MSREGGPAGHGGGGGKARVPGGGGIDDVDGVKVSSWSGQLVGAVGEFFITRHGEVRRSGRRERDRCTQVSESC